MSESAVQIIARGARKAAEAAAAAIDADPMLEGATYSILEEDEDKGIWRIDAFPTSDDEADGIAARLRDHGGLRVAIEKLADADWLAMSLSGLPPVRAGRFFVYGAHDQGRVPANTVNLMIDAGAAFGTGHHGTTVGCLVAFDELLKRERFERVLDVGCRHRRAGHRGGEDRHRSVARRHRHRQAVGAHRQRERQAERSAGPLRPRLGSERSARCAVTGPMIWCSPTSSPRRWWPCRRTSRPR